ncbi:MAG: ATP-binding protein, partial [Corynebacterium sp.]|nr:ATP-binding protein [Corynebacterium sp.]
EVIRRMGMQVHEPSLHSVPDGELTILYAIAELSENSAMVATGDIATLMQVEPNALSMQRRQLLRRGLLTVPKYGYLNFALPYMREHLLNNPQHRPL